MNHQSTTCRRLFVTAAAVMALSTGLTPTGFAAEYGAELSLASAYTDNLTLAPSGLEKSQWLNAVVPRVYLTQVGGNYEVDIDYELQALFYAGESELNEAYSQLWATGLLDLVGQELVLRGFARATQVNIDPEGRLVDNNINITGNRSDALAWEVGPRWHRFIGTSELDTYFYVGQIYYDDPTVQGSTTQDARIMFGSDLESTQRVNYQFDYRYRNIDYDETGPAKFQRIQLELGYFTNPFFQLIGIVGSENNIVKNDGSLDEPYWQAGFRGWFGKNRLEALYGRRYYGPTYRVEWVRTMPSSELRVNYRELQATEETAAFDDLEEDTASDIEPMQDETLAPDSGLNRPGSGVRSLSKRWRGDYRVNFYRSDVRFFVFLFDREQVTPPAPPAFPNEQFQSDDSYGAGFDLTWETGSRTRLSLFGDWTNRTFDTDRADGGRTSDLFRSSIRVRYDLGTMTQLTARIGVQKQTNSTSDFDERHAGIEFRRYFANRR